MFRTDPERHAPHVRRSAGRQFLATLGVFALVLGFITVGATTTQESAEAASGSDFNAGNIISDAEFYNPRAMSQQQVQAFLNSKVSSCLPGYVCLKDFSQATATQSAKSEGCSTYPGSGNESAAAIIYKVGIACGISQEVLLVLLEKEQGLVSDDWPTARQYRSATGYGCPDTADCDANYYGFFNQVYHAAYQFKKYQANPNSRGYIAGRYNSIQWNPNGGCGASNVFIENQATAGLYVYTPYRPNDAALNNMYGSGDSCSSYGNRNFWRMYTDWFGDTHGGSDIVRDTSTGGLWVISGTDKFLITTMDLYYTLAALGSYRDVPASYLNGYTTGVQASELVRNPVTGEISLVQGNTRHRFGSCNQVSDWGFNCANAMNLTPALLAKLPAGGEVSSFVIQPGSSAVYYLNSSSRFPIEEWAGVLALNGGAAPWIGTLRSEIAARYPVGRVLATPGSAVKAASSPEAFLIDGTGSRISIPSMGVLNDYGLSSIRTVTDSVLNGYPRAGADLTVVASCNGTQGLVNGGAYSPLSSNGTGIAVTPLTALTCSTLDAGATISSTAFVVTPGSSAVFMLVAGGARPVWSWSDLLALNKGATPVIPTLTAGTIQGLKQPGGVVAPYSLVKSGSASSVWLTDGIDRKLGLDSFGTSDALGIHGWRVVSDDLLKAYPSADSLLSRVVTCSGTTYIGLGGTLYPVAAGNPHGLRVVDLSSACTQLNRSSAAPLNRVFVKSSDSASVYYVVGGQRRPVQSWSDLVALNGGSAPQVFTVAPTEISSLPDGGAATL